MVILVVHKVIKVSTAFFTFCFKFSGFGVSDSTFTSSQIIRILGVWFMSGETEEDNTGWDRMGRDEPRSSRIRLKEIINQVNIEKTENKQRQHRDKSVINMVFHVRG